MRPDQRLVTRLPLTELWDVHGPVQMAKSRAIGCEQIADLLRQGRVRFVVANSGLPLNWVSAGTCYRYWKEDVKPHLVEPDVAESGFQPEDFPGEFCFIGTEWGEGEEEPVVLLEAHH